MVKSKAKESESNSELGAFLSKLRKDSGFSLRGVEDATSRMVSNAYLSQLEKGKIKKPSPNILYSLSDVYGVKYEELMRLAGYSPGDADASISSNTESDSGFSIKNLTADERTELMEYLKFYRSRKGKKK